MKPDWKDAPEWAKWLCQDSDGRWVWFERKPRTCSGSDDWKQGRVYGMWDYAQNVVANWKETLERRP